MSFTTIFFLLSASFFDGYLTAPVAELPHENLCSLAFNLVDLGFSGPALKQKILEQVKSDKYNQYYGYYDNDQNYYGKYPYDGYDSSKYEDTSYSKDKYTESYYTNYKPTSSYQPEYKPTYKPTEYYDKYGNDYGCYGYNCKTDSAGTPSPDLKPLAEEPNIRQLPIPQLPSFGSSGQSSNPTSAELESFMEAFNNILASLFGAGNSGQLQSLREQCSKMPVDSRIADLTNVLRGSASHN